MQTVMPTTIDAAVLAERAQALESDMVQFLRDLSEVPINGPAPAIANAIYNAVGVRLRKLPMRPEDVLAALRAKPEPVTA
jgi:hypothetical protein